MGAAFNVVHDWPSECRPCLFQGVYPDNYGNPLGRRLFAISSVCSAAMLLTVLDKQ